MTQAASTPMTAEQLLQRSEELGRCELLRGELLEMTPAGNAHGILAMRLGSRIEQYVRSQQLGVVYAAETGFVLERNPDTVRAPDVAFLSNSRGVDASADGFVEGAPDFAVEVVSPSDTASYVAAKVEAWLHHGTQLVWVADPHTQTITAYTPDHHATIYHVGDTLPGDPVLPGLALPLSEIFNG